jgi:hypothetical protein
MLIGFQTFDADAVMLRRQRLAGEALLRLDGVTPLNVQFRDGAAAAFPGIETAAVLLGDSLSATGAPAGTIRRKPIAREVFDVLASRAVAGGHRYFAFINADIVVTPAAIREIERRGRESYVISRSDVSDLASRTPDGSPMTAGLDMFVVSATWWQAHAGRFRPYVIGETCWDCVYTAMLMCHSRGIVLNRDPLIFHERHAPAWHELTPSARYNGMLAALDSRYFSLWAQYWMQLEQLRAAGATAAEEEALQHNAFVWRPSPYQAARQIVRGVLAKRRYQRARTRTPEPGTRNPR